MKPVYSFQFVDTVYSHFSDEVLANIASDFLRVFRNANFKDTQKTFIPEKHLFASERSHSDVCVKARPGKVSIDFSKAITQGWAGTQIYDAETLIDEVYYRAQKQGIVFNPDISLMQSLREEINTFINKFGVPRALNAEETVYTAQQTCEALRI